jgi:hypothetical protein
MVRGQARLRVVDLRFAGRAGAPAWCPVLLGSLIVGRQGLAGWSGQRGSSDAGEAAERDDELAGPGPACCDLDRRPRWMIRAAVWSVRQSYYPVPARYAGRRVEVRQGATRLIIYDGASILAEHPRSLHKYSEDLVLDHYVDRGSGRRTNCSGRGFPQPPAAPRSALIVRRISLRTSSSAAGAGLAPSISTRTCSIHRCKSRRPPR